jgi:glycosyltransferase involved in cell wall biosynthesis
MSQEGHRITPVVSVIMPTWNGEQFLRPAIDSIFNQTFTDFELIIIDDNSTDSTSRILSDYKNDRLVILTNEHSLGIAGATNRGLAVARGEYVALQDHDDISLPQRLQTQVEYLDSHPEIALVGSDATLINDDGTPYEKKPALGIWANRSNLQSQDDLNLKWDLLFGCPFYHISVMIRRTAILDVGGYRRDPSFQFAQDFELLSRVAVRYRVANLTMPLVLWRRHSEAAGRKHSERQQSSNNSISFRNMCTVHEAETRRDRRANHPNGTAKPRNQESFVTFDQWSRFLGLKAFLCTPEGKLPDLPPAQVLSGVQFLYDIQENFYRMHRFPRFDADRHRRPYNWIWGKHAIALAVRAPWDWRSRIRMFRMGIRSLRCAAWTLLP